MVGIWVGNVLIPWNVFSCSFYTDRRSGPQTSQDPKLLILIIESMALVFDVGHNNLIYMSVLWNGYHPPISLTPISTHRYIYFFPSGGELSQSTLLAVMCQHCSAMSHTLFYRCSPCQGMFIANHSQNYLLVFLLF